jgi:hypothetical protein
VVEENQWTSQTHTRRLQREKRACAPGIATPTAFLSPLSSLSLCVPSSLSVSLFVSVLGDDERCFFIEFFDELSTVSSIRLPRKN